MPPRSPSAVLAPRPISGRAEAALRALSAGLLAGALALPAPGACGDSVTVLHCPVGTDPVGSECVPICKEGEVVVGDLCRPSASEPEPESRAFPTLDAVEPEPTAPEPSDAAPDAPEAHPEPGPTGEGATGASCISSTECAGGACIDWPGGYCSQLDCHTGACPVAATCAPLHGGNHVCLSDCTSEEDCRPGGEVACKRLDVGEGHVLGLCHGVEEDAGAVGETCGDDLDCAGAAICLPSMPGGYCAVLGCDAVGCPSGSVCVPFGGIATCLKTCNHDQDCGTAPGAERRCGLLKALDKSKVEVCISGAEGGVVGESCLNDFECGTGTCQILGEGTCTQSEAPCFEATEDQDCIEGGFCLVTGANTVGTCTQPCSLELPCPGASACEGAPGLEAEGLCRPLCGGPASRDECPQGPSFLCIYGRPLGDTSGQGAYLCSLPPSGGVGTACTIEEDCLEGSACDGQLCVAPCSGELYCPFPGTCVASTQPALCKKACLSIADCPPNTACQTAPGSIGSFCQGG